MTHQQAGKRGRERESWIYWLSSHHHPFHKYVCEEDREEDNFDDNDTDLGDEEGEDDDREVGVVRRRGMHLYNFSTNVFYDDHHYLGKKDDVICAHS